MKKLVILILGAVLLSTLLSSCGEKKSNKVGVGVYTDLASDSSAIGGGDGHTKYVHTVAVIAEDKTGKITACDIDVAEINVEFTSSGKAKLASEYKTKGQMKDSYGMKAAGAKLEWYEQRDAFCKAIIGKTVAEVKGSVNEDGKGSDYIIAAGCTVKIDEFVKAIVKADENAESVAKAPQTIKVDLKTDVKGTDATETDAGLITSATKIKVDAQGIDSIEKSADFKVWFSKTGILQPEPEKKEMMRKS